MLDTKKMWTSVLIILVIEYFICSFVVGDFNLMTMSMKGRGGMACISVLSIFVFFAVGLEVGIFDKETPKEKETRLKKYIGELSEELELYGEAKALERKVRDMQNKKY